MISQPAEKAMATSVIPMQAEGCMIATYVSSGGSFDLEIETEKTYLITMMTSSEASARVLSITNRGGFIQKLEIASGSYQGYFTETISNGHWQLNCTYYTILKIICF